MSAIICTGCKHGYADTALFCPNCGRPKVRETTGDALVGKLLGERFQVQALLGQGGSGTIYRAEHVTLRRRVAIKVLHQELSRDDLAVERFRREATTVADIDNEHIVEIHDFGRTPDGRLYLAMELLEGETLDTVLAREKQLSMERAADILIQVGEALMEAHAIGYVHRDLRPRNIYLTTRRGKANFVKLLDFGLAKLVEVEKEADATNLGMTFGDPRYMSPEQARGDRIDRRADIYQLGCVAYEMVTGAPPFSGNRVFDILTKQVTETPAPVPTRRPGTPLWMEAAIAKMLAKDPENRFATTTRMVEALRRGLDTGEVMDDEVARRRESVPPASVSRVMAKLGISSELPALPPKPAPAPAQPVAQVVASAAPIADADDTPSRRTTGTPKVGVPVVKAPVDAPGAISSDSRSSVTGSIDSSASLDDSAALASSSASGSRSRRASSQINETGSWYDDDPSTSRLGDSMYDAAPIKRSRLPILVGFVGVLALGGVIFAMTRTGEDAAPPKQDEPVAATPPPVDVAPSVIMDSDHASVPPSQIVSTAPPTKPATTTTITTTPTPAAKTRTSSRTTSRSSASSDTGSIPATAYTPSSVPGSSFSPPGTTFSPPGTTYSPPGTPPGTTFTPPGTTSTPGTTSAPGTTSTPGTYTPPAPSEPAPIGVSGTVDGPQDPYGGGGGDSSAHPAPSPTPAEGNPEQKATFFANLGNQQLASGDTAGAAANFKKALELDSKNFVAIAGQGEIALRQGLFGDAIVHLKKAARIARSARVYTLLGEAYLNSGNANEAAEWFKKALQLDPDNARARDGYNEAANRASD